MGNGTSYLLDNGTPHRIPGSFNVRLITEGVKQIKKTANFTWY